MRWKQLSHDNATKLGGSEAIDGRQSAAARRRAVIVALLVNYNRYQKPERQAGGAADQMCHRRRCDLAALRGWIPAIIERLTRIMSTDHQLTQELLQRVRDGDQPALDLVLERHRAALQRMIRMRLDRNIAARVDASDVVQDVLWEASRRLNDYLDSPRAPFHLWLRQLARDRMIDLYRQHRRCVKRSVDRERSIDAPLARHSSLETARQLVDGGPTPASAAMRVELHQRFLSALETLGDADREIIAMRHFECLTNRQVAELLECTDATAGMRYLRAMRRLRAALGTVDDSFHESGG